MCQLANYKKKIWKKNIFFVINEERTQRSRIRIHLLEVAYGSGDPHPDPHQNVMDRQHWLLQVQLMN